MNFNNKKFQIIKLNRFSLIIFILICSCSINTWAKEIQSCEKYLKNTNQLLEFKAPSSSDGKKLSVIAIFAYDLPSPILPDPFRSFFNPSQQRVYGNILKLTPFDSTSKGVELGKRIKYSIAFTGQQLWFELYSLTINNRVICQNPNGRSSYETHTLEIPLIVRQNVQSRSSLKGARTTKQVITPKPIELSHISPNSCGVVKQIREFVRNGSQKNSEKWPWIAGVFVGDDYVCSATFISRSRAVTAAHCFKKTVKPEDVQLYSFADKYLQVSDIQKHRHFKSIPTNDIAYVDLETPIIEQDFVPVCLAASPELLGSLLGKFGSVVTYAPVTTLEILHQDIGELRGGSFKIVENEKCDSELSNVVPTNGFCAGEGKKAYLCHGDSGGGFYKKLNKKWFLLGVLSTGIIDAGTKDCKYNDYVVFMDVTRYQRFIVGKQGQLVDYASFLMQ